MTIAAERIGSFCRGEIIKKTLQLEIMYAIISLSKKDNMGNRIRILSYVAPGGPVAAPFGCRNSREEVRREHDALSKVH